MYLENLKVGDKVLMRGPKGNVDYSPTKFGSFTITKSVNGKKVVQPYHCKKLCFIAGGSGITPCLQIIREVLKGRAKGDTTKLYLLYANQTEKDILLRDELDELAANPSNELNIHYTLDRPPQGWAYSSGFIDEKMIQKALPPADDQTFVFMCGPPPMIKFACLPNLEKNMYKEKQWHSF
jgi:cytochrome-b5 reductase